MSCFYKEHEGGFVKAETLWEALQLDYDSCRIISLVGAGGKTSSMYQLVKECQARGQKVIVTTSTHIACPDEYPVVLIQRAEELEEIFGAEGNDDDFEIKEEWPGKRRRLSSPDILVVAGEKEEARNKLAGMDSSEIGKLGAYCDVLLIEADGARMLPFKIPGEHEPVIIEETQVVVGCVGLSAIGKSWRDSCFRWERRGQVFGAGEEMTASEMVADKSVANETSVDDAITAVDVARALMSDSGTRKCAGSRRYCIILNQMDDEKRQQQAETIVECLKNEAAADGVTIAASCYL